MTVHEKKALLRVPAKAGTHGYLTRWAPAFAGARSLCISFVILANFTFIPPAFARQMDDMPVAVLRTIDKVSARTLTFEVPVDKTVKFGTSLFIKPRACRKAVPLEEPESAAFLQIWEKTTDDQTGEEKADWVFSGWMFASSPALSAMDHPVYNVWVVDCKNLDTVSEEITEFSEEAAPDEGTGEEEPLPVVEEEN